MANFFGEVTGQVGSVWKKLSTGQKMMILMVSVAMLAGIVGVTYLTSRLDMSLLYGSVSPENAGRIQAKLDELGVNYELKGGGSAIYVPSDKVYELRNQLSMDGITQTDGHGMEIFDEMQLGMTEFLQNVQLTRALEGELARTISSLEQVSSAKVHITRPKPTIFTELQSPPSAAVVLKPVPGRVIGQREVMGIANVVACTVEGLDAENVKITDNKGRLLTKPAEDFEDQMASGQLETKMSFENNLKKKAQAQLDQVVGPNKVSVTVNLELDFQQQTKKLKEYTQPADGKLIISEKTTFMETKGATQTASGVPGQITPEPSTAGEGESTNNEDVDREFAINESESDIIQGGATITRLSLAIVIDQSLEPQSTAIEEIVKEAVGFDDQNRQDSCKVAVMTFTVPEETDDTEALESYESKEFMLTLVKYGIQGLSVAGVIIILFIILKKSEKKVAAVAEVVAGGADGIRMERDIKESQRNKKEVVAAVQSDPIMASEILHEWLDEEDI